MYRRRTWAVFVVAVAVTGCETKIDGSSEEAMKASVAKMKAQLSQDDQKELEESVMLVALEDVAGMNILQLGANSDQLLTKARKKLDGRTFADILKLAARIKEKRAAKAAQNDEAVVLMRGMAYSGPRPTKKKNPNAKTARVHVSISAKAPVSIDGGVLGEVQHHVAELTPGVHHVDVTVGSKTMRQVMKVEAGEEFKVYFDLASKTIDVDLIEE